MNRATLFFLLFLSCVAPALAREAADPSPAVKETSSRSRVKPEGKTGQALENAQKTQKQSAYSSWKMRLPFWPRKAFLLAELTIFIVIGVFVGQMLEVLGVVRAISFITWPVTAMGKLPRSAGPPFLMAFQSGAVANTMLVSGRDQGILSARELYTSVFVVSCLSLFAHLPTFVIPIGMAFGGKATLALFGVRFAAIILEILCILAVSRVISLRRPDVRQARAPGEKTDTKKRSGRSGASQKFFGKVWHRSRGTIMRLCLYLVPTFATMAMLEYLGFFTYVSGALPGLFSFSFLPSESLAIIPAQALSLYNGAIVAANFIDAGAITTRQAVVVILFGSVITSPIRTLKHALPTYIAILGARPGTTMAVSAQALRSIFVILCTFALMLLWK